MRIAVIENEFGEVGVDDALVLETEEEVFEMNNGCVCCTVRGDLLHLLQPSNVEVRARILAWASTTDRFYACDTVLFRKDGDWYA